jgi:hypothetical protein
MRTTINLRDEALELGRKKARELGQSLGDVVSNAVLAAYGDRAKRPSGAAFDLPESGSGGLQPGVDLDDSASLADLMESRR